MKFFSIKPASFNDRIDEIVDLSSVLYHDIENRADRLRAELDEVYAATARLTQVVR